MIAASEGQATRFRERFTEIRESVSLAWQDGATCSVQFGARRGCGTRRIERDGTVHFESRDAVEGPARDGGMLEAWGPGKTDTWSDEVRALGAYLSEVRDVAVEVSGSDLHVRAVANIFRQQVSLEAEERRIVDARAGALVEIGVEIPNRGKMIDCVADATLSELIARRPAGEMGRALGTRFREEAGEPARVDGVFPVVLSAGGCEAWLHEIGHLFEGDPTVPFAGTLREGAPLGSSDLTLTDDPVGRRGRGSYLYDDEGREASRVVLIEAGRVGQRIRNGRRASYRDLPLPRMSSTMLEPSREDPRAIISGTPKGLLVRRLGSGSIDPESGKVTLSVTDASLIEGGSITRSLAPSFLLGDAFAMLDSIDAVGSDLAWDHGATNCVKADQQLSVMVGLPTIRLGMITVISPY